MLMTTPVLVVEVGRAVLITALIGSAMLIAILGLIKPIRRRPPP
jgi:hypothetical protein